MTVAEVKAKHQKELRKKEARSRKRKRKIKETAIEIAVLLVGILLAIFGTAIVLTLPETIISLFF